MEKYSELETVIALKVLETLMEALYASNKLAIHKNPVRYVCTVNTFDDDDSRYCGINFDSDGENVINPSLGNIQAIERISLVQAEFYITGTEQPIATFNMQLYKSVFETDIADIAVKELVGELKESKESSASEPNLALSKFIAFVTHVVNNNLPLGKN